MKTFTKWITSLAAGCLTMLGLPLTLHAADVGEHAASPATEAAGQGGISQFQIILRRNIFDPSRGSEASNRDSTPKRQPRIETFSFRGAAEKVGKGFDAFFTGDGAPASGTVAVNDVINGFMVREINLSEVKLMDTNQQLVILKDQTGLTRQDGGPWSKLFVPTLYRSSAPTRQSDGNDNGQSSSRPTTVTEADTSEPQAPINPAVLASMEARRTQEN
jgi:hypothetical protein